MSWAAAIAVIGGKDMDKAVKIAKVMLMEAAVSLAALCLFAVALMKMQPSEGTVRTGVKVVYVLVNLLGGFLVGKVMHQKKFLWGGMTGLIYFAVLSALSFLVHQGFYSDIQNAAVIGLLCVGGGMVGGMLS